MDRRIVITGMGVLSPAGVGPGALAEAVRRGRSAVGPITRFDPAGFPSRIAGEVPEYDPVEGLRKDQGRYVKKNAKVMARDIQLALAAASRAILNTGLPLGDPNAGEPVLPTIDHARFGVIFGSNFIPSELDDLAVPVRASSEDGQFSLKGWGEHGIAQMFPLWLLKYLPNMHACHTGVLWDAQGPSNSLTCSDAGGLLALDEACRILDRGDADWMLAAGGECRISPVVLMRYCLLGRLVTGNDGPASACRPFDEARGGWVVAEGAAALMLESLDAAQARSATVYGEVLGTGAGTTTAGVNACDPDGRAVAAAVTRALDAAAVEPADLGAVLAHGTALEAQDRSETAGLASALGPAAQTVPVTATKGVTGHMGAASGLADLAAMVVLASDGHVPPILNCDRPDPETGLNLVTGKPQPLAGDLILVTTNAIGGQTAAAVIRVNP